MHLWPAASHPATSWLTAHLQFQREPLFLAPHLFRQFSVTDHLMGSQPAYRFAALGQDANPKSYELQLGETRESGGKTATKENPSKKSPSLSAACTTIDAIWGSHTQSLTESCRLCLLMLRSSSLHMHWHNSNPSHHQLLPGQMPFSHSSQAHKCTNTVT